MVECGLAKAKSRSEWCTSTPVLKNTILVLDSPVKSGGGDLLDHARDAGFVDVGDGHIRAGAKKPFRKCSAQSTSAAGNDHRLPGESEVSHESAF